VQSGVGGLPVELEAGATLRDSHVSSVDPVLATVETRGTGSATIAGSTIDGGKGGAVRMTSPGTLAITTSRLSGSDGAVAKDANGTLTIDSSLVRATGTGVEAQDGHLVAENVTLVGDGQPGTIGAESFDGNPGGAATLVIENSVITGFDRSLQTAHFSGTPTLTARFSNYTGNVDQAAGTLTEAQGNMHVDPGFVDAAGGDFRLRADSPVLDQGSIPAPGQLSGTDLGGDPRIADGTGKGTPVPDMGAFEFQPHAPSAAIAGPGAVQVGSAASFSSAGSTDPDAGDILTAHWSIGGVSVDGPVASQTFSSAGPVQVTLTVTDRAGLSATASTTLDVQAAPVVTPPPALAPALTGFSITRHRLVAGHRAAFRFKLSKAARVKIVVTRSGKLLTRSSHAGSIARSGHAGRNRIRFSGRIRGRKLKPGRYVATVRATDAGGRSSSKRVVKFTILR
jgi:hypothetical protein